MVFDHQENLRQAINTRKAKIAEIDHALNQPVPASRPGQPIHVSPSSRLRLQEAKLHQLQAVAEMEQMLLRSAELAKQTNRDGTTKLNKTVTGSNIDRLRKECGWSFNDLADSTGLDKKLILGHVNAGKGIRPNTLRIYADTFTKQLKRTVSVAELET
jgi:hypothetical protein